MKLFFTRHLVAAAALAACVMLATQAPAQKRQQQYPSPKQFALYSTNQMADRLNLTPAQQQQVYDANLRYANSCYQYMGSPERWGEFQREREAALQGILNSDQYQSNQSLYQQNANYYNQTCWGPYWGMGPQMMWSGYGGYCM